MSIDPSSGNDPTQYRTDEVPLHRQARKSTEYEIDSELVDQTKNQIRTLVQEIAELAKSDCSEEEFYQGFLTRTTSALASVGGVIWTRAAATKPLKLLYHINLKRTNLVDNPPAQMQHSQLLEQVLESREPHIVAPNSGTETSEGAGNPTDFLLIFAPLIVDHEAIGLVEIFQRTGGGPATQRGYLRFLSQMAEIASDFLKTRRLRTFQMQQELWQDVDRFSRSVHSTLDIEQTAFVIANDGRRIIGCDRVSVARRVGHRYQVIAVSGLDSIERRAEQIKHLGTLTRTVVGTGEPLWYEGDDAGLAPQVEKRVHAYVDLSHSRLLGIIPLYRSSAGAVEGSPRAEPLGALIVEKISESRGRSLVERRAAMVAEHAETALSNAHEHNSVFLMPLWKRLGWLTAPFQGARLPTTLTLVIVAAAVVLGLCIVPYPFSLGGTGELIAESQQEIFTQRKGKLIDVFEPSSPSEQVPAGFILARMEDNDLNVEIESLQGELQQYQEQVTKLKRMQSDLLSMERIEQIQLLGELMEAEKSVNTTRNLLSLREMQREQLTVTSPIDGFVADWQLRRNLLGRPVDAGQKLMTVVAPETRWQLEVLVPERRMGHLLAAVQDQPSLPVSFALASNPGRQYTGTIERVDSTLDVYDDNGNCCRVLVAFDNASVPESLLRSGTRITAKIHCGNRSVGYVLFHELYESAKSSFMYWF
jgi:transcriptional regulator with GAF, ATPase, and Fis domain/multidrug efflux pump subunit AcrA (membrane-fusion protein)